jgi:NAD(P)H dehydrogenase (quinone)
MSNSEPILVTGAAGQVGGIGGRIVELLRAADTPVRALVRRDDERAARLRRLGAEVVVADPHSARPTVPLSWLPRDLFCRSRAVAVGNGRPRAVH